MTTADIVGIIVLAVLVIGFIVVALRIVTQRQALHSRFGDEYDRTVEEMGGKSAAEAELRRRRREHDALTLKPLSDADRVRYGETWRTIQAEFVDDPTTAVNEADRLVAQIVADRGYPVVDYPDRLKYLSVEHANALTHYRSAHDVTVTNEAGQAATEDMRQAMVHYRELVTDLLGGDPDVTATPSITLPVTATGPADDTDEALAGDITDNSLPADPAARLFTTGPVDLPPADSAAMTDTDPAADADADVEPLPDQTATADVEPIEEIPVRETPVRERSAK